jgi:hypothetical protein
VSSFFIITNVFLHIIGGVQGHHHHHSNRAQTTDYRRLRHTCELTKVFFFLQIANDARLTRLTTYFGFQQKSYLLSYRL